MASDFTNGTCPCNTGYPRDVPNGPPFQTASGNLWTDFVSSAVQTLGEPLAFCVITNIVIQLGNWPITWFYLAADKNGWMKDQRIWRTEYAPESLMQETIPGVFQTVYATVFDSTIALMLPYYVLKFAHGFNVFTPMPNIFVFLLRFGAIHFCIDFIFFWMHKAFHEIPFLWHNVHKYHHMYNRPNALAHYHFAKFELVIQRFFKDWPVFILFKITFPEYLAYQLYSQLLDIQIHCGYDHGFKWVGGILGSRTDWHLYHHSQPGKGAYTLWMSWIDEFFGTARNYKAWREARLEARKSASGKEEQEEGPVKRVMLTEQDEGIVGKDGIYGGQGKKES